MNHDPLYLNWEFWTALAAIAAIVLSQIPPVYQLIRKAKLTMEVYSRAAVGHYVGIPNVQVVIVLSNIGGHEVKVRRILMTVCREDTVVATLPAQLYCPETDPSKQLLFAGFKLKPDDERSHNFFFYLDLPRAQERELKEKTQILMTDINAKRAAGLVKEPEGDPANVAPFFDIMKRNFIWSEGEYVLKLRAESSDATVFVEKKFRFTLFESDSSQLREYAKRYKYGEGIYYGSERQWLWIKIAEG